MNHQTTTQCFAFNKKLSRLSRADCIELLLHAAEQLIGQVDNTFDCEAEDEFDVEEDYEGEQSSQTVHLSYLGNHNLYKSTSSSARPI